MNPSPVTPTTLNTIRRNAGKLPPTQIAYDLGWTVRMLERVAFDNRINLRVNNAQHDSVLPENHQRYTELIGVRFSAYDFDLLDIAAKKLGIPRGQVVRRVIENARSKGILQELAALPAPLPDRVEDLDE